MPTKKWFHSFDGVEIEVSNVWDFKGNLVEEMRVNNVLVDSKNKPLLAAELKDMAVGYLQHLLTVGNQEYLITAKLGSKWHGCSVGCHIFVNGELVGGDKGSKLLFV